MCVCVCVCVCVQMINMHVIFSVYNLHHALSPSIIVLTNCVSSLFTVVYAHESVLLSHNSMHQTVVPLETDCLSNVKYFWLAISAFCLKSFAPGTVQCSCMYRCTSVGLFFFQGENSLPINTQGGVVSTFRELFSPDMGITSSKQC